MSTIMLTLIRMTPDAVPAEAPLSRLVAAFQQRATYAVARSESGAGPAGHALTALALAEAIRRRTSSSRWGLVELALQAGAALPDVAAATGLDVDELVIGYGAALDVRVLEGKLTVPEANALRRLVDDGPR